MNVALRVRNADFLFSETGKNPLANFMLRKILVDKRSHPAD
jgi:hypothetical protein